MQTYSHLIITAALARPFNNKAEESDQLPPLNKGALMLGSIIPDLPLTLTTIGCISPVKHNLPPSNRLFHPGPGVDGPGPGVMPMMAPPPARSFQTESTQIRFTNPAGMTVGWADTKQSPASLARRAT